MFLNWLIVYYRIKKSYEKFQSINETVLSFLNAFWNFELKNIRKLNTILNNNEEKQIFAINNKTTDKYYEILQQSKDNILFKMRNELKNFERIEKIINM